MPDLLPTKKEKRREERKERKERKGKERKGYNRETETEPKAELKTNYPLLMTPVFTSPTLVVVLRKSRTASTYRPSDNKSLTVVLPSPAP